MDDVVSDRLRADLARKAYAALAGAFKPCPPHLIPSFRLWHYPAAGPHVTWVVFQRRVDDPLSGPALLRRIRWQRDLDLERLEVGLRRKVHREPTLETAEAEADEARLAELVRDATGLSFPRFRLVAPYVSDVRKEFGLEGFDVEGRDGRPVVRLEWDQDSAPLLLPLVRWADRARQWLVTAFEKSL